MVEIVKKKIDTTGVMNSVMTPESGAIDMFVGTTRNHASGRKVESLEYEAYEPMALKVMNQVVDEARTRWSIHKISIVHRIGKVDVGEASVVIAVSSAHRSEAFQACRFLIDRLKNVVPIWKKEFFADGSVEWSHQAHEQAPAESS